MLSFPLLMVVYCSVVGANVNAQTQTGDTALTYACENGHTEVVEVLLDEKCDIVSTEATLFKRY